MKINIGCTGTPMRSKLTRMAGMGLLVAAAVLAVGGCTGYYGPAYGGGYYSAGYGYPYGYGYGYGDPYYGSPYYGGSAVVISGVRYRGYRAPYYRNRYYPRNRVQSSTTVTRRGATVAPSVKGSSTRTNNPRTQATLPQ